MSAQTYALTLALRALERLRADMPPAMRAELVAQASRHIRDVQAELERAS